jgi:hypothetical protein
MCIAYAPRLPGATLPWLFELDPTSGTTRALLPDRDGNVLNVARRHAPEARHASLRDACRTYAIDPARDLELRWWDGPDLALVVRTELDRLGIDAVVRAARPGVVIDHGGEQVALPSAFALRAWERALAR